MAPIKIWAGIWWCSLYRTLCEL